MNAVETNSNVWRSIAKLEPGEIFYFNGDQLVRQPVLKGLTYMLRKVKTVNRRESLMTLNQHLRTHQEFYEWFLMMLSIKENRYANDMIRILKEWVIMLPDVIKGIQHYRKSMKEYDQSGLLSYIFEPQDDTHDANCETLINKLQDQYRQLSQELVKRGIIKAQADVKAQADIKADVKPQVPEQKEK
jgi:hypothetical protein